jgi:heat-inducible transcriptional repressor
VSDIQARAKKVLHAVVSEYLQTGEAVGSETVAKRYSLEVSSATIRTVMGELEEMGLLRHPHTSSGRIPTDRGLRLYVDALLRVRNLSAGEKGSIRERVGTASEPQEVLPRVARILRELSHLAVVLQTPRPESDRIAHLEFVRLREGRLLAVIESTSGQIQNKLVHAETSIDPGELVRMNNYLNELVAGLTLHELRTRLTAEIEKERLHRQPDPMPAQALALAAAAVPLPESSPSILVDGQANLLEIAPSLDSARHVLRTLEEKSRLAELLDRTLLAPGICVFIGAEAKLADLTDISVVAASYGGEGRPLGTIGVIGPSRMNYSKVIPLVDFTADVITEVLPGA